MNSCFPTWVVNRIHSVCRYVLQHPCPFSLGGKWNWAGRCEHQLWRSTQSYLKMVEHLCHNPVVFFRIYISMQSRASHHALVNGQSLNTCSTTAWAVRSGVFSCNNVSVIRGTLRYHGWRSFGRVSKSLSNWAKVGKWSERTQSNKIKATAAND